ncbi:MAG: endo-1,4-beta-xylanase [Ignavibacteriae bacterium]|nr:endo-1,4-beta-xylanase [Ignavibacteriota bacterium]
MNSFLKVILSFIVFITFTIVGCKDKTDLQISLKEIFKDYYLIGTALNYEQVMGRNPKAIELVKQQFNSIIPENILKWERVHPEPGVFNFEPADSLVAFGLRNKMFIIGHTLLWHQQTPNWVFDDKDGKPVSRDTLLLRLKNHIQKVVGRYKGKINGWDVVNEAIDEDGNYRKSKWLEIIGEDYIDKAFQFAHEADPNAELYYNDFNMWYPGKIKGVEKLVKELQTKNIKIDGIGLQGHWGLDYPSNEEIDLALETYSKLNVNLMITELDMAVLPIPDNNTSAEISKNYELKKEYDPFTNSFPDSMQVKLGKRYADFFNLFNKYKNHISRVTFWGVSDANSWRNNWPILGRTSYPMLFDRNYLPKPAFDYVIKTVK